MAIIVPVAIMVPVANIVVVPPMWHEVRRRATAGPQRGHSRGTEGVQQGHRRILCGCDEGSISFLVSSINLPTVRVRKM